VNVKDLAFGLDCLYQSEIIAKAKMLVHTLFAAACAAWCVSAQGVSGGGISGGPRPQRGTTGCTTNSFTIPSWFVNDLQYAGGNGTLKGSSVSFKLLNRANNITTEMACQMGKTGWNACGVTGNKKWSNETLEASVHVLNGTMAHVLVNQTWTCNDRKGANGTHP